MSTKALLLLMTVALLGGCATMSLPPSFDTAELGEPVYSQNVKFENAIAYRVSPDEDADYDYRDEEGRRKSFEEAYGRNGLKGYLNYNAPWGLYANYIDPNNPTAHCRNENPDNLTTKIFKHGDLTVVDVAEMVNYNTYASKHMGADLTCIAHYNKGLTHRFVINPNTGVMVGTSFDPTFTSKPVLAWILPTPDPDIVSAGSRNLANVVNTYVQDIGNRKKLIRNAKNGLNACDGTPIDINSKDFQRLAKAVVRDHQSVKTPVLNLNYNYYCRLSEQDRNKFNNLVNSDILAASKIIKGDVLEALLAKQPKGKK